MIDILYYIIAVALVSFGVWGVIDALKQVKKKK